MEIEERIDELEEFLSTTINDSEKAVECIKDCMYLLKQIPPADVPNTFAKEQILISKLDDLQWLIYLLNKTKTKLDEKILNIKAPEITYLIREGRIGTDLINIETYNRNQGQLEPLTVKLDAINNTLSYLSTLEGNMNKYLYMLRDRLQTR